VVESVDVAHVPPAPQFVPVKSFSRQIMTWIVSSPPEESGSSAVVVHVTVPPGSVGESSEKTVNVGRWLTANGDAKPLPAPAGSPVEN